MSTVFPPTWSDSAIDAADGLTHRPEEAATPALTIDLERQAWPAEHVVYEGTVDVAAVDAQLVGAPATTW